MPRFFFNIEDHVRDVDDEGTVLRDVAEARRQAIVFAGSVLRDDPGLVWDGHELRIEVRDEDKRPVMDVIVRAEQR